MTSAPIDGMALRVAIHDAIEQLIDLLDELDGDCDLEPKSDDDACDSEVFGGGWARVHVKDQREWGGL